eukprot:XP_008671613.1 LOW QUALITY PROTEIN: uncharacterized protein LOC103649040 [Zea mays]
MAFLVLASPSRSYLQRWLPSPPRGVFSVAAPCMIPLAGVLDYSAMEVAAPSFPHLPPSVLISAPLSLLLSLPWTGPLPQLTPSSCHGARPYPSLVASVSPYLCWRLASHLPCVGRPPLRSHRWHLSVLQLVLMAMPLFPRSELAQVPSHVCSPLSVSLRAAACRRRPVSSTRARCLMGGLNWSSSLFSLFVGFSSYYATHRKWDGAMVLGGVVYTAVPFYKRVPMVEDNKMS